VEQALSYEQFEDRRELFQGECLDALATAREEGVTRGMLDIFTSGGKTEIAIKDVKAFLADQPDARVLVLSHRSDLSEQLRGEFEKGIGAERKYGRAFGGTLEDQEQFVFANFQTMTGGFAGSKRYEAFQPDEFDIDLTNSYMIGDRESDIMAGMNAGTKTILVQTGNEPVVSKEATYTAPDVLAAITYIAGQNS
jgi:hypothetical protein